MATPLNGNFGVLWELVKRELDGIHTDVTGVDNRMTERFNTLDERFEKHIKEDYIGVMQRLESVETRTSGLIAVLGIVGTAVVGGIALYLLRVI